MKKVYFLPILAILALCACSTDSTTDSKPSSSDQGAVAGPLPEPANAPAASSNSNTSSQSTMATSTPAPSSAASSQPAAQPTTSPQPATNYPKGIPVAGKKGYVLSPYAQYAGLVDVSGFPSGSIVSCPYTHKKFVVP